jgi:staphyloferrin B biosynthesis citrate synthase
VTGRGFRERLRSGEALTGVFVKTPSHQVIEVLAAGGTVDVVVLDTEHAAFDPSQLDAMLAVAHALPLPCLVRVAGPVAPLVQSALDGGATGVVVPHVASAARAADVARWSAYGTGGRGFSGSTRSAGWGTRAIADVLTAAAATTTVIVQVEDVAGVDAIGDIVDVVGVDAVFVGAADLTVGLGCTDAAHPKVTAAIDEVVAVARRANRALAAFASTSAESAAWRARGVSLVIEGTDQGRLRTR